MRSQQTIPEILSTVLIQLKTFVHENPGRKNADLNEIINQIETLQKIRTTNLNELLKKTILSLADYAIENSRDTTFQRTAFQILMRIETHNLSLVPLIQQSLRDASASADNDRKKFMAGRFFALTAQQRQAAQEVKLSLATPQTWADTLRKNFREAYIDLEDIGKAQSEKRVPDFKALKLAAKSADKPDVAILTTMMKQYITHIGKTSEKTVVTQIDYKAFTEKLNKKQRHHHYDRLLALITRKVGKDVIHAYFEGDQSRIAAFTASLAAIIIPKRDGYKFIDDLGKPPPAPKTDREPAAHPTPRFKAS